MTSSALLMRKTILQTIQSLFEKYGMSFKVEGDIDCFGFGAELPQAILALPPAYDVDNVIQQVESGQSLNIPHQGYCINKELVISIIRNGLNPAEEQEVALSDLSTEVDRAISYLQLHSICKPRCAGKDCIHCSIYNAKKNALIGLNYLKQITEMQIRVNYLKEHAESQEARQAYQEVENMLKSAYQYSTDRANIW